MPPCSVAGGSHFLLRQHFQGLFKWSTDSLLCETLRRGIVNCPDTRKEGSLNETPGSLVAVGGEITVDLNLPVNSLIK